MTDRYENIRRALAMGPTPGEWYWTDAYPTQDGRKTWSLIGDGGFGILSCDGYENSPQSVNAADAELIAACDSDTIRELLAERDQLAAEIEALRAEVERLRADLMESDEIRDKLGHLLTRTAAALKGEPPEGVWHSWHDLPERAERLNEALEDIRRRLANLPTHPDDPWEFTAICRVADAALAKENNND